MIQITPVNQLFDEEEQTKIIEAYQEFGELKVKRELKSLAEESQQTPEKLQSADSAQDLQKVQKEVSVNSARMELLKQSVIERDDFTTEEIAEDVDF